MIFLNEKHKNISKEIISCLIIIITAIVFFAIYSVYKANAKDKHNNGICDYCNKSATHHFGNEEFCDDHYIDRMGDIIEWSSEKNK